MSDPFLNAPQAPISTHFEKTIGLPSSKNAKPLSMEKMKFQAQEFEGQILGTLLNQMFTGIGAEDNSLHAGQAESTWRGLLNEEYGKSLARNGGIGLADAVVHELVRMQAQTVGSSP